MLRISTEGELLGAYELGDPAAYDFALSGRVVLSDGRVLDIDNGEQIAEVQAP